MHRNFIVIKNNSSIRDHDVNLGIFEVTKGYPKNICYGNFQTRAWKGIRGESVEIIKDRLGLKDDEFTLFILI